MMEDVQRDSRSELAGSAAMPQQRIEIAIEADERGGCRGKRAWAPACERSDGRE